MPKQKADKARSYPCFPLWLSGDGLMKLAALSKVETTLLVNSNLPTSTAASDTYKRAVD